MVRVPRPAPWWNSPRPARLASFSRCTGQSISSRSIATRGTFFQPCRLGGLTSMPRSRSVGPGAPIPTHSTGPPSLSRRIWSVAHSTTRRGVRRASVRLRAVAMIRPSGHATATRTWVPPRSIPAIISRKGSYTGDAAVTAGAALLEDERCLHQRFDGRPQLLAEGGEAVPGPDRWPGIDLAIDQASLTQLLETLAHHPLGEPGHSTRQLGEARRPVHQRREHRERPSLPDETEKAQLLLTAAECMNLGFHRSPDGQD